MGRQGGGQTVSLSRQGCLYHGTVQHELLHALGFNHEQTRSDRDNHIQVVWDNIIQGRLVPPSGPPSHLGWAHGGVDLSCLQT